jgi:riboflavin synthase
VFTGLIQDLGTVEELSRSDQGARLRIATPLAASLRPGDSIAVNGVCLTATSSGDGGFEAEAMNQTLTLTSLGPLEEGDRVNLELPLRAGEPLGGHIVQGHVDGTAEVVELTEDGFARRLRVRVPPELARHMVERGSVTLDGVSLTVSAAGDDWLEVSLIPETLERTNLGRAQPGTALNVETDVVAKYVERLVSPLSRKEETQSDA